MPRPMDPAEAARVREVFGSAADARPDLTTLAAPELYGYLARAVSEAAQRDHDRAMQIGGLQDRVAELEAGLHDLRAWAVRLPRHKDVAAALYGALHGHDLGHDLGGRDPREVVEELLGAIRSRIQELEGEVLARDSRIVGWVRHATRSRVVLRALTDATAPYATGAADASHAQTMEAESALAVAWRAARDHLVGLIVTGERASDDGTVAVDADDLSLIIGEMDDQYSPELRAAYDRVTALLQTAAARPVEIVQTNGGAL